MYPNLYILPEVGGHVILYDVDVGCLDIPEKFLNKGGWWTMVGIGLFIFLLSHFIIYENINIQNTIRHWAIGHDARERGRESEREGS
jgi:hypothetical protein